MGREMSLCVRISYLLCADLSAEPLKLRGVLSRSSAANDEYQFLGYCNREGAAPAVERLGRRREGGGKEERRELQLD